MIASAEYLACNPLGRLFAQDVNHNGPSRSSHVGLQDFEQLAGRRKRRNATQRIRNPLQRLRGDVLTPGGVRDRNLAQPRDFR